MKSYIILIILVTFAYVNSLQNQFVWDEGYLIVENPKINLPLKEIPSLFLNPLGERVDFDRPGQAYYRPILSLLFVLNYKVWGLNPLGFHLTNILLHLVSVIILYRIGLLFFNPVPPIFKQGNNNLISLIGASIFAVHPINNEPVGRVASGEAIFGFLIILSVYFFLKEKKYLSWITFFLALFSKETAVMLPFTLIILSTQKNGFKKGIIAIIPYIALVGIYILIRMKAVSVVFGGDIMQSIFIQIQILFGHGMRPGVNIKQSIQILTMLVAAFDYIRLLIIPYPLSPFYLERWHTSLFESKVIAAIIALSLISFIAFKIRKDKTLLFLLLFPFIMLVPVIWKVNSFTAGSDFMYIAERFLYVPAMIFSLFVSASFVKVFKNMAKRYLMAGWMLVIVIFTIIIISANTMWKDNLALYREIMGKSPDAAFVYKNLGNLYAYQNRLDEAMMKYIIYYKKIIEKSPDNAFAHYNLGAAYAVQYRLDEAMGEYIIALKINPNYAKAHNNLGEIFYEKGQLDEAIREYSFAIKLNQNYTLAYYNLGNAYYKLGKFNDAVQNYLTALKLNPDYADAHYNLGVAYQKQGLLDEAIKEYLVALRLEPNNVDAHFNLGNIYKIKGLKDKAREKFEIALRLRPDNQEIQRALDLLR